MSMPTAESQESLSAAYAFSYDYAQQNQPPPPQYQDRYAPPTTSSSSNAQPPQRSSSASASNAGLSRAGGSVGSSGSQSYYSSATTQPQTYNQQQAYSQHYPDYRQYQQHTHPSPPTTAYRPPRHISSNYPEHATSAALNPANAAAAHLAPAPPIPSNMYAQSNISMPALGPVAPDSSARAPPLADDLGDSFANMNLYGTPRLGPQRAKSPAYPSATPANADAASTKGVASAASVRANAMYANQEIHQSAAEVHPENSLAAIADQVDQAAADLDPNVPSQTDHSSSHHTMASSSAYHASQTRPAGGGGAPPPDWNPQQATSTGANSHTPYAQHYASGMRQHSAPGEYPPGAQFAAGSTDGHAAGAAEASQMQWDPNAAAAARYYPANGAAAGGAGGAASYPAFQPQALHHASAGYPFSAQAGQAPYPPAGGAGHSAYETNPYFAAATGYLGFPEGAAPGFPPGADAYGSAAGAGAPGMMAMLPPGGGARPSMLSRQGTQLSMMSTNSNPLAGMATNNPRRKSKDAAPQQTLPFNKSFVTEYRQRMKGDPDPEAQFAYAKYLIEAAKKVHDPADGPKQQRKYRDTLLFESLKLIKRLATTGMGLGKPPYAEAQFFLANCFGNGSLGLQVDHEKAYNLYVQASKQNHPAATYRTAVCNEVGAGTRRDHHRAVLFYRKASALGDTAGMYKLGMVLLNGMLGQLRNVREAIVWLKRAAAQADEDNPHALHELGLLHEKPTNGVVLHDEAYARELFTQAAQLGYSPSQFKLGSAYEYGNLTCPVDPRRSIAWYTKAAQRGDGESELALSGWYLTGSEGVLKQSDSEAYLWARRAASKGIPKAEYAVGYYSEVGIGVAANLDEAKRWYMRAAAQGNKRAMQRLTELKKMKGLSGKKGARPTRKDAESECVVM
ncbi:related to SKT5-activator of chitin synthase III [Sporisorium reilianum SRZ2]|uniref:Related to SKT5-activator of chitin synthase III n=1 Tax=Sporisorium reilianum (strain SRZ2) TaxID=999809 RepID=E6ZMU2_SPORE|nr:related to SKT5-activator of chitin synthase III [Sporisorium reilianum SRZ2]